MFTVLLLFTLLIVTRSDDKALKDWAGISSPPEGFSVKMPRSPKVEKGKDNGPDDKPVKFIVYRANVGTDSFLVTVTEFSPEYIKQSPKVIFDNARNGSLARSGGKLVSEETIKLGKREGREVIVEAPKSEGFVRARVFVANDRQYSVMVASKTKSGIESENAKWFFDSFKIVKLRLPDEPPPTTKKNDDQSKPKKKKKKEKSSAPDQL